MNSRNEEILYKLIEEMETLLSSGESGDFDRRHIHRVDAYSQKLAGHRGLDVFTARCIAVLHDIGRLKYPSVLKGHGETGALMAKDWLQTYGLEPSRIETIVEAIGHHPLKKKIHGLYSELIKDADALAHEQEGSQDWHEGIRVSYAYQAPFKCTWVKGFNYQRAFEELVNDLSGYLSALNERVDPHECIHDIRVTIRKIRALCWLVANSGQEVNYKQINELERQLKQIFKDFERPRELYVFYEFIHKQLGKKEGQLLEKKLKRSINKVQEKYKHYRLEEVLTVERGNFVRILTHFHVDNLSTTYVVTSYLQALKMTSPKNITSLHELRIVGKRMKYLYSIGCVAYDDKVRQVILKLHDDIGNVHDGEVHKKWRKKLSLNKKLNKILETYKKEQLQVIKPLLFELKIQTKINL